MPIPKSVFDRLMLDIQSNPIKALICSKGSVYGKQYLTVEPIGGDWIAMRAWCKDTFGTDDELEYNQKWYAYDRKFWFKDSKDRDWFILRWSS